MQGKIINNELLYQIMDKYKECDKKEQINEYILDTVVTCERLCTAELHIRVLTQFKIMLENLANMLEV